MGIKFTTIEEVEEYLSGDRVECLLCGRVFKAITPSHLFWMHDMELEDYRQQFGIPKGHRLCGTGTSEKHSENAVQRWKEGTLNGSLISASKPQSRKASAAKASQPKKPKPLTVQTQCTLPGTKVVLAINVTIEIKEGE